MGAPMSLSTRSGLGNGMRSQSADMYGEVQARAERNELPEGPPSQYKAELDSLRQQHAAKRELRRIYQTTR
jgi:hypothetical protein